MTIASYKSLPYAGYEHALAAKETSGPTEVAPHVEKMIMTSPACPCQCKSAPRHTPIRQTSKSGLLLMFIAARRELVEALAMLSADAAVSVRVVAATAVATLAEAVREQAAGLGIEAVRAALTRTAEGAPLVILFP